MDRTTADYNCIVDGSWSNDYPNGKVKVDEQFPNASGDSAITATREGNVIDGLYDGEAEFNFKCADGHTVTFRPKYNKGKAEILKTTSDGYLVVAIGNRSDTGAEAYLGDATDGINGIEGFCVN